ncbi:ATP-binding protein [Leptospira weilii]|uniref:ATP-binding protein n=1 Tax=Leptospira weilii TaxID=28184 RepID=UPI001F41994A|nr:ATP-binding protein [Leptospira weilii]
MTENVAIRPYARLLTMLGEQLIKNERIALIELIKNSYDADANWVKVIFSNFESNYRKSNQSQILIIDSGFGMSYDQIKQHFLNPATPIKKRKKEAGKHKTPMGRIVQGEKGIGRFALLKLGRRIKIISREKNKPTETVIDFDFTKYDEEFLTENGKEKDLFIDNIEITLTQRKPETLIKRNVQLGIRENINEGYGTIIEISDLRGDWSASKIGDVYDDLLRLQTIFPFEKAANDFEVFIYKDDEELNFQRDHLEKLDFLLKERSVFRIEKGVFDPKNNEFKYSFNGKSVSKSLLDPEITGLKVFREGFKDSSAIERIKSGKLECGSFGFGFYIFDFSKQAPKTYLLDKSDRDIIKPHRIYLYRDGIRVYPYGEPDDDWLRIDAHRGTISAGHFLSNDQVVGYVNISQVENKSLKDKTNREGLIEEGFATSDFISILQSFLSYIRMKPYRRYRIDLALKKNMDSRKRDIIKQDLEILKPLLPEKSKARKILDKIEANYEIEKNFLIRRAEVTEELAGVGLSVETASHDIMSIMQKVAVNLDSLLRDLISKDKINKENLINELQSVRGGLSFVESQLKDIQLLFKSSKQKRKNIRVSEILVKVERIYNRFLNKEKIKFNIIEESSPLMAKTTDAVLLQLFLNLFDNSIYWLQQVDIKNKKIEVLLDGSKNRLIFSDNGPGISKLDAPYIFEPFYSGRGEDGRGLGLYIAKQLLERNEYSIYLAELKSERIESGANFVINFISEEE